MKILALIFFLWNPDGTVDMSIKRVENCDLPYEIPPNVTYMCVEFTVQPPGEPT